jgi:hypothetical protein
MALNQIFQSGNYCSRRFDSETIGGSNAKVRIVPNRAEAQGTLVDLLNPQPLSHASFHHAESNAPAIPHNRILEPPTAQRRHRIGSNPRFVIPGTRVPVVITNDRYFRE